MSLKKRGIAVFAAAALSISVAGGVAYAYWTATATATGSVAAGTTLPLVVTQITTDTDGTLAPDGPAVAINTKIHNPNSFPIHLTDLRVKVDNMPGTGCDPADFWINGSFNKAGTEIPAGADISGASGWVILLHNTGANQDGCKGLNIPLVFTVN